MARMSPDRFREFIGQSCDYLEAQIAACVSEFRLGDYDRYDIDQWRGEIVFSHRGRPKVAAKIQFVGSLSNRTRTWLWAWANPSILEAVRKDVLAVRRFGARHRLGRLTRAKWSAEETDGWEMTAVAARLLEAQAAYRSPDPTGLTFLLLSDMAWAKGRSRVFATFTCRHVTEEGKPILRVLKEHDGDVQLLCGGLHPSSRDGRAVPLDEILDKDPSLLGLADLPIGWCAVRKKPGARWRRSPLEP